MFAPSNPPPPRLEALNLRFKVSAGWEGTSRCSPVCEGSQADEHATLHQADDPSQVQLEPGVVLERESTGGHRAAHHSERIQRAALDRRTIVEESKEGLLELADGGVRPEASHHTQVGTTSSKDAVVDEQMTRR